MTLHLYAYPLIAAFFIGGSVWIAKLMMESTDLLDRSPASPANKDNSPLVPVQSQQWILDSLRDHAENARAFKQIAGELHSLSERLRVSLSQQAHGDAEQQEVASQEVRDRLTELIRQCGLKQDELATAEGRLVGSQSTLEHMLHESRIDPLTNLPNRRALDEILSTRLAGITDERPLSVALIDIDEFKRVNLAFGHPTGDHLLMRLGFLLPPLLGEDVTIARYGGDEFAVVMDEPLDACVERLEHLRDSLAGEDWSKTLTPSKKREECDAPRACQISIGASAILSGTAKEDAFANADDALYHAKCNGRNRTCYHDGSAVHQA